MDKEVLFKRKAADRLREVEIDEGVAVTVRALSLAEVKAIKEENASAHTFDNRIISAALVDPVMTPAEVAEWVTDAPAGDYARVEKAVMDMSGMSEGATKSNVAGVSTEPRG